MKPVFILVSGKVNAYSQNQGPLPDYHAIASRVSGELHGYDLGEGRGYRWARRLQKWVKLDIVEAVAAARVMQDYSAILSLSEKAAIPLAAALQITRHPIPHILIAHKLSSGLKTRLFDTLRLYKAFSHIICVSRLQADYAVQHLGLPESQVTFVYDKVDHRFFHPGENSDGDYILAVGQEQRDYDTLLRAVQGTGLKLVIVASSPWSSSQVDLKEKAQADIRRNIPFEELRRLYAGARLVVLPLFPVDYAAGANGALEAMATGKPLILSRSPGLEDYVEHDETGYFVPPQDSATLRDSILSLWENPVQRQRLGANARRVVEERMNMDTYVNQIASVMEKLRADA